MKKVGILIHYGTELRPFYENQLSVYLSDKVEFIYLIRDTSIRNKLSSEILHKAVFYETQKIPNNGKSIPYRLFLKFNSLFIKQRKARQRKMKLGNYHFTTGLNSEPKLFDSFFGNQLIYTLFRKIYSICSKHFFYSNYISEIFKENQVTDVLYYGSNMTEMSHLIQTAKLNKLNLWHYVGSWKDIYIDDYIPVEPTKMFVWSSIMKFDIANFNSHIDPSCIIVSGNLFFCGYRNYKPINELEFYSEKYNISISSTIYLWPLSMKIVFPNEHVLLSLLDDYIELNFSENKPTILLRDNPFGASSEYQKFYEGLKNIRLVNNFWYVSAKEDFLFQTSEGETEWADLLYYSKAIISTPSTVTLESILFGKPSINILFDETGNKSEKIGAFANAPFYRELLKRNDVFMCDDYNKFIEIFERLQELKPTKNPNIVLPSIIDGNASFSLNEFVEALED